MSDSDEVLAANDAFYRAFAERDIHAMDALWARQAPVACIHPGWNAIVDRRKILSSWEAILSHPAAPPVRCFDAAAHLLGHAAFVTCYEAVSDSVLVTTNVFVRESGGWKMVHHHAGPSARESVDMQQGPDATLH